VLIPSQATQISQKGAVFYVIKAADTAAFGPPPAPLAASVRCVRSNQRGGGGGGFSFFFFRFFLLFWCFCFFFVMRGGLSGSVVVFFFSFLLFSPFLSSFLLQDIDCPDPAARYVSMRRLPNDPRINPTTLLSAGGQS